jgi:hypothetical protein
MVAAKDKLVGSQRKFDEGSGSRLCVERLFASDDETGRVWWLRGKIHDGRDKGVGVAAMRPMHQAPGLGHGKM